MPKIQINIGNFKVYSIAGTSSLVVGTGNYQDLTSQSKTTNGVGSAYGDGSYINMSPYQSQVNDPDMIDSNKQIKRHRYPNQFVPMMPYQYPYYFQPAYYPYVHNYPVYK